MAAKTKKKDEAEAFEKADDADGESDQPKWKLPLKLIAVAAGGLLVLAGGGTTAYFVFGGKKDDKTSLQAIKPVSFLDMPEVMVNLSSVSGERVQYLKVKIVLELPDQTIAAQIQPVMPRVLDTFQTYLRELRPSDLEGSAGLYRLREELTRRINNLIAPHHINAVLFREVVVQ